MSLKNCKECSKEISSSVAKCPHCGKDQRSWFRKHPILTVILGLFLLGIFGSVLGGNKNKSSSPTSSNKPNENSEPSAVIQEKEANQTPQVIDATALVKEFDKNKLAANDKYKGKLVQTTGYIKNISNDVAGNFFLSLNPSSEKYYMGTTLACYFKDKAELTLLSNGESVTVQGTMKEMSLGLVVIENCKVVK